MRSRPVALKDVLSADRHTSFLLLFVRIYCLSSLFYFTSHMHMNFCASLCKKLVNYIVRIMLDYNVPFGTRCETVWFFAKSFSAFSFESCNKLFAGYREKISICQSLLNVLRLRSTGKRLDRCNTDEKSQKITLAMKDSHSIILQDKTDKEAYYERVEDRLIRNVKTGLKTCSSTADCGPKEMRWTALLETCQRQKQLPPQRHNFT